MRIRPGASDEVATAAGLARVRAGVGRNAGAALVVEGQLHECDVVKRLVLAGARRPDF